ncbi:MAG: ABC transporter substrate-binding protein [Methanobacteriaceae archaeon]|jgi:ABC-type Fe3+ transport system substrate-binding protein
MFEKLKNVNKKILVSAIVASIIVIVVASIFIYAMPEEKISIGHIHRTADYRFGDVDFQTRMYNHARADARFAEGSLYASGSGDLREYLKLAIAGNKISRGVLFSYNHLEVTQLLEQARPLIAEFPNRYPLRPELAELADPTGEIHTVWSDAYVIVYNPKLINRADVPKTLADLANFDQPIGVPTEGCQGTWGTVAFYHHLGSDNFTRLMNNAQVRGSQRDVTTAVYEGNVTVAISSLLDTHVRDGKVGVIWPEEGAIAKPGFLVIPNNPTELQLNFADFLMSPESAALFATEFNMVSALPNGPAPQIVKDNNFNFVFIPWSDMADTAVAERVAAIIG